jgi:hypothetical protein
MITIRRAGDRGHRNYGWLDTFHTFSFNDYHDPAFMGFRSLRVINEDRVEPGEGFGTHPHRDLEIITYVLSGALAHRDSMGNGSAIRPGEVQRMSAGTGVTHSEFNGDAEQPVHFLQIWLLPERKGIPPSYEQKAFPESEKTGRLRLVASRDGREGSVRIHQDADLYATVVGKDESVPVSLRPGRYGWVQVARGAVRLNEEALAAGDGASVSGEGGLTLTGLEPAEILVFDLA